MKAIRQHAYGGPESVVTTKRQGLIPAAGAVRRRLGLRNEQLVERDAGYVRRVVGPEFVLANV